jgi:predicted nucleic acid-binding protein
LLVATGHLALLLILCRKGWLRGLTSRLGAVGQMAFTNYIMQSVICMQANLAAHTCPVWFELLSGARPEEEDDLTQALAFSRHVPFEREDWPAAALLERQMRTKGVTIPRNDLFVVTVAIRTGLTVICRDQHFEAARQVNGRRLKVEQL